MTCLNVPASAALRMRGRSASMRWVVLLEDALHRLIEGREHDFGAAYQLSRRDAASPSASAHGSGACFTIRSRAMKGFITTKVVLLHPVLIIRSFGVRVYGRCLARMGRHHGNSTFLECI